jgi:hypothetical protein
MADVREDVGHQPPDDLLRVQRRQPLGLALFHDLGLGPGGLLGLAQVARVLALSSALASSALRRARPSDVSGYVPSDSVLRLPWNR